MNLPFERALVLAPHTDDGELGCGGTIAKLIEAGTGIEYVAFSICEESVPAGFPSDVLATEVANATALLGIGRAHLHVHRYPVRFFPSHRQEILEDLVKLRRQVAPDLVLLPSRADVHQDHQVMVAEGIRAFKYSTILGYELPWNTLEFASTALVALDRRHVEAKLAALQQYASQQHRSYVSFELIEGLARVRGQQADSAFAEAFEVIRWVMQ